jgi:hypothetical protein
MLLYLVFSLFSFYLGLELVAILIKEGERIVVGLGLSCGGLCSIVRVRLCICVICVGVGVGVEGTLGLRSTETRKPVGGRCRCCGSEVAVRIPLLQPARLARMQSPAHRGAIRESGPNRLPSLRAGVAIGPALALSTRDDAEGGGARAASLAILLAVIEELAGDYHRLPLVVLTTSPDGVVAYLVGDDTRLVLKLGYTLLLLAIHLGLGITTRPLSIRESRKLLIHPHLVQVTPADAVELSVGQLEIGLVMGRITTGAVADGEVVGLGQVRDLIHNLPRRALLTLPEVVLHSKARRAAAAGKLLLGEGPDRALEGSHLRCWIARIIESWKDCQREIQPRGNYDIYTSLDSF